MPGPTTSIESKLPPVMYVYGVFQHVFTLSEENMVHTSRSETEQVESSQKYHMISSAQIKTPGPSSTAEGIHQKDLPFGTCARPTRLPYPLRQSRARRATF